MHYVYSRAHSTFWGSLAGSSSLLWLPLQEGVRCWVSSRVVPSCWTIHTSNSWPWLLTQFHGGEFGCHGLSNLCKCMRACNYFKLWCQDIFVFPCIYNYIYIPLLIWELSNIRCNLLDVAKSNGGLWASELQTHCAIRHCAAWPAIRRASTWSHLCPKGESVCTFVLAASGRIWHSLAESSPSKTSVVLQRIRPSRSIKWLQKPFVKKLDAPWWALVCYTVPFVLLGQLSHMSFNTMWSAKVGYPLQKCRSPQKDML